MKYSDLIDLDMPPHVWSLIQRGLANAGFYEGTYKGIPGPRTRAAYLEYAGSISATPWLEIAEKEIGVKEYAGAADNPAVTKYLRSVDNLSISAQRQDETAWCSAFVNWVMEKSGISGTENAAARSWLKWGTPITFPTKGCVAILWRGKPDGWQGHVGFYMGSSDTGFQVKLLGGNQSDQVSVSSFPTSRVLGYRMPS